MTHPSSCPFCEIAESRTSQRLEFQNDLAFTIRDGYPVSLGHTLVISKRHIGSFFEATAEERAALVDMLDQTKQLIQTEYAPSGYNIGINDGPNAGQTVPHLHIHLIPRYQGDTTDPRGGVRWVIPEKADYWSTQ